MALAAARRPAALSLTALTDAALAQSDLPLPPGTIIIGEIFRRNGTSVPQIETGAEANTYLEIGPPTEPFTPFKEALVVRTSAQTQYVRVYTEGVTNPIGSFLAGSNTIRGLDARRSATFSRFPIFPIPSPSCWFRPEPA